MNAMLEAQQVGRRMKFRVSKRPTVFQGFFFLILYKVPENGRSFGPQVGLGVFGFRGFGFRGKMLIIIGSRV